MEEKILKIIKKVRSMYKYNKKYDVLLGKDPSVDISIKNEEIILEDITFQDYDCIIVDDKMILFKPYYGEKETLITYNGFDELLKL